MRNHLKNFDIGNKTYRFIEWIGDGQQWMRTDEENGVLLDSRAYIPAKRITRKQIIEAFRRVNREPLHQKKE